MYFYLSSFLSRHAVIRMMWLPQHSGFIVVVAGRVSCLRVKNEEEEEEEKEEVEEEEEEEEEKEEVEEEEEEEESVWGWVGVKITSVTRRPMS
jgi:hypothetical protein